jgi:phage shock protein C
MATRRLYRSRSEKMIGGVAGGLAEYLDVDVSLVRFALLGGGGLLAYIVLWIIMPVEPPVAE